MAEFHRQPDVSGPKSWSRHISSYCIAYWASSRVRFLDREWIVIAHSLYSLCWSRRCKDPPNSFKHPPTERAH